MLQFPSMLSYGGTEVAYYTEAACISYCMSSNTCTAVDFNFDDLQCYMHTGSGYLQTVNNQISTVSQYRRYNQCDTIES